MTNATGTVQQESTYYPFGGEQRVITNTVANNYKFTGFERDSESGLDDTLFRKYAQNLGRWLSPDPIAGSILDPQSLNRYLYVLNDPLNLMDHFGLCPAGTRAVDVDKVLDKARSMFGQYKYGETTTIDGKEYRVDCTGFLNLVLHEAGYSVPLVGSSRISEGRADFLFPISEPQPGAVMWFLPAGQNGKPVNHIAIISGADPLKAIASNTKTGPTEFTISGNRYWEGAMQRGHKFFEICIPNALAEALDPLDPNRSGGGLGGWGSRGREASESGQSFEAVWIQWYEGVEGLTGYGPIGVTVWNQPVPRRRPYLPY